MTAAVKQFSRRRGDPAPESPRDVVLVLRPDTAASPELAAAARATGGTVTVVLPLKIHGYSLGMPNPGLMPTARERAAADEAITTTVRRLRRAGVDVDGQIVVSRHAHRAIVKIARRRGATQVLLEGTTAGRLRRFVEGDLSKQLARRLAPAVTVAVASGTSADEIPGIPTATT
ncbi:MAG: universal stress protein [Mycobacterium sp.]|nr:universal stress protein [Mycobacterium sp.]